MRQINFGKTTTSYFLSTGEKVEYDLPKGVTFIQGVNESTGQEGQKNGVGKTNIFYEPYFFALYGELSRNNVPKADIPFDKGGKKKCIVCQELDVVEGDTVQKVKITRIINPSKLILEIDGVDMSQSNARSTQEYIVSKILKGIKKEVFMQSVALKADSNSFFEMGKPEREKFIGTIFDLTYIKETGKLAGSEYLKTSKSCGEKNVLISSKTTHMDSLKNQIRLIKSELDEQKDKLRGNMALRQEAIDQFELGEEPVKINVDDQKEKIQSVLTLIKTKLSENTDERDSFKLEKSSLERNISTNRNKIRAFEDGKACLTCDRPFEAKDVAKSQESIKELEIEIKDNTAVVGDLESKLKSLQVIADKILEKQGAVDDKRYGLLGDISKNGESIQQYRLQKERLDRLIEEKDALKKEIDEPLDSSALNNSLSEYKGLRDTLAEETKIYDDLVIEMEVLECVKVIFGDKGLRSAILARLIDLFNSSLNNYLAQFNLPYTITFNDNLEYVVTGHNGVEKNFNLLSGGEKWRANTALFFTFSDILRIQNQIGFNIKLFDEYFDYAVCPQGLENVSEVLIDRLEKYGENVLIITHRKEFDIPNSQVITVVKERGMSRILEDEH